MAELKTIPLRDLCASSRSITYGIVQPGKLHDGGVPIVRVNNFRGHRLDLSERLHVAPEIEVAYRRSRPEPGDVLISLVGSIGQAAIAPPEIGGWNLARAVGLVPMANRHHAEWVFYALQTPDAQAYIHRHANTTVQATFNLKDLARFPIPYPEQFERERVLEILGSLDDKIELNRRMNETLEAMAQAIFADWFVDFGPTRRKRDGATDPVAIMGGLVTDPDRARDLAALFPVNFGDDGLPEGWVKRKLDDVVSQHTVTLAPQNHADEAFAHHSIPAFDKGKNPVVEPGSAILSNKTLVPPNAVLLSKLNPEISRVWLPEQGGKHRAICSTEFLVYTAKGPFGGSLLHSLFSSAAFRSLLVGMVTGTSKSHQRVSPKALAGTEVLAASAATGVEFEAHAGPLLDQMLHNRAESRTLAATRDLLLPKLMSGEIRLRDAEREIEAVA